MIQATTTAAASAVESAAAQRAPAFPIHTTTKRREWWGLFGAVGWMFFMMYGWDFVMNGDLTGNENGTWHQTAFKTVLALSIIVFAWLYGRDPAGLSKLAFYTAPAAFVATATFALFPMPLSSALYVCSPVLFAPALVRRIYGNIRTGEGTGYQCTRYMSYIAVCVFACLAWMLAKPPKEVAYLAPALLSVPAWAGIRRRVTLPERPPEARAFKVGGRRVTLFAAIVLTLFCLNMMNLVFRRNIVVHGEASSELAIIALGILLPPVGFTLYAFISDKGYERLGIVIGMGLLLMGSIAAFMWHDSMSYVPALLPMAVANGLGGSYTQYFSFIVPLFFYRDAKRPVFAASFGAVFMLLNSALEWQSGAWLPEKLRTIGTALLVTLCIFAVVFIVLVHCLFERRRENTLAAALHALLVPDAPVLHALPTASASIPYASPTADAPAMQAQPAAAEPGAAQTGAAQAGAAQAGAAAIGAQAAAYNDGGSFDPDAATTPRTDGATAPLTDGATAPRTDAGTMPRVETGKTFRTETGKMFRIDDAGLTPDEMKVALLLIDGMSQREITRRLHMSASEVNQNVGAIREKVVGAGDTDPVISIVTDRYKLTRRETDMLRFLRRGMSNDEIAAELYITSETVRSHVRNLLNKLPVKNRRDIGAWDGSPSPGARHSGGIRSDKENN